MDKRIPCGNLQLTWSISSYRAVVSDLVLVVEETIPGCWSWRCLPLRSCTKEFETPEDAASGMRKFLCELRAALGPVVPTETPAQLIRRTGVCPKCRLVGECDCGFVASAMAKERKGKGL